MKHQLSLITIIILLISSCGTSRQTSILHGDSYDETTDNTTYILIPYGNVNIPGKWERTTYNQVSGQQFFTNANSASIAIAKTPKEKYSFYLETKNDSELVSDFYKWDSDYLEKQGLRITKLHEIETENFIIWQAIGEDINNVFLFGIKNNLLINYMVSAKWTDERKIEFLTNLYRQN
jgi:hypothetical protein